MSPENNLTVIILTHNEGIHIKRCIDSLAGLSANIFVVDSGSTDDTVTIAESMGAVVAHRKWVNYADQFQWGLDNYPDYFGGKTPWVMRMDADEYLEADLVRELPSVLRTKDAADGYYIRRKVIFYGKWIRYGGFYPHILMRVWRDGLGRIEQRWMDEHIVLEPGSETRMLDGHLIDENLKGITFWVDKHNSYASREMVDLLNNKYHLFDPDDALKSFDDPHARVKRIMKDNIYSRLPVAVRSTAYFLYRYFIRLGFLDGAKGFLWHFLQGYWYRMLVDVKIMEMEDRSGGDIEVMKRLIENDHGIKLPD